MRSDRLASLIPRHSNTLVPFGLQVMKTTAKILYMSSTQMPEPTGTTTPNPRDSLRILSATNNRAPIDTITKHASGSCDASGKKTTPPLTSVDSESSLPKNVGLSITNTLHQPLRNWNSPPSSPLSPRQPPTYLESLHSNSQKPVLAPHHYHSTSEEVGCTCARKLLQHLFRPYPKPTPHPHLYPRLRLRNLYYAIKSTFNTSTNPTLCRQHKPTFRHRYNQLRRHTASINIPRWILNRSCKRLLPSPTASRPSPPTLTDSYRILLQSTFLLRSFVLNHMSSVQQRKMERCRLTLDDF